MIHDASSGELEQLVSGYLSANILNAGNSTNLQNRKVDRQTKSLLSYLFEGARGGTNRLRIMLLLTEKPLNAHQIAKGLGLDYNAIEHHIAVLEKNNMIYRVGPRYGAMFFLSTFLEVNIEAFNEIVKKFAKH
ncbi:MAG: winged helix-turn-helix transcriptional regulator [Thaumarchaeota archaeon]|nr:winged helix-turn-helix transcriptional regulator [Nitrososphaerota archaeon]